MTQAPAACVIRRAAKRASVNFGAFVLTFGPSHGKVILDSNAALQTEMAATVTSKGQVTIPKPVRDLLGIKPGSTVESRQGRWEAAAEPFRTPARSCGQRAWHRCHHGFNPGRELIDSGRYQWAGQSSLPVVAIFDSPGASLSAVSIDTKPAPLAFNITPTTTHPAALSFVSVAKSCALRVH